MMEEFDDIKSDLETIATEREKKRLLRSDVDDEVIH